MRNQSFYIKTYGCQMNERDSEALTCLLEEHGFTATDQENKAQIIILNTCSVREAAENKAVGKAGILGRLKKNHPDLVLIIIGCMAQNLGAELLTKIPHLDGVVGTDCLHQLPEVIEAVMGGKRRQVVTKTSTETNGRLRGHPDKQQVSSFVSVMRGCNQYCSYCIVPLVRGQEKSRPLAEIIDEVEELAAKGCREIFLLGQNITAYGLAEAKKTNRYSPEISPFADLLREVNQVSGIERIRFTSPHPKYMNEKFIDTAVTLDKICESFHLPLQSGSDQILNAMRRGYTAAEYLQKINSLKQGLPNATFSTDVIVGFPGESDEDFTATRELMETVGFDMAYIFKYSPRRKTRAARMADDVATEIKESRNQLLLSDLAKRTSRHNRSYLGRTVEVLLEGPSKRNPQRWSGRSRDNKTCLINQSSELRPGMLLKIKITKVSSSSLFGVPE